MNRTLLLTAKKNNTSFMILNITTAIMQSLIAKILTKQQTLLSLHSKVKVDIDKATRILTIVISEAILSHHPMIRTKLGMNM